MQLISRVDDTVADGHIPAAVDINPVTVWRVLIVADPQPVNDNARSRAENKSSTVHGTVPNSQVSRFRIRTKTICPGRRPSIRTCEGAPDRFSRKMPAGSRRFFRPEMVMLCCSAAVMKCAPLPVLKETGSEDRNHPL